MTSRKLRRIVFAVVVIPICADRPSVVAEQPDHVINIWPHDPPGERMNVGPQQDLTKDTDKLIAGRRIIKLGNVKTPQAHVYLPPANLRTGASVVICPGGGFSILAWDLEGTEVAQWLNTLGVAGIVLKYRVPTRDLSPRWMAAAQDTQRTVSLVRHRAQDWGLDPHKVAVLGFSAGGMAAVKTTLAPMRYYARVDDADEAPYRPDRTILIYSAGLPKDVDNIGNDTPTSHARRQHNGNTHPGLRAKLSAPLDRCGALPGVVLSRPALLAMCLILPLRHQKR